MDISVIIPVYNEEGNLERLYKELKSTMDSFQNDYEIIFVSDKNADNSAIILNKISKINKQVKVIHFDKKYGLTSALDAGFCHAQGEFIFTIHADMQCKTSDLIRVYQELQNNDVVIGYRINQLKAYGFIKTFSSKIGNYVRKKILGENFQNAGTLVIGFRRCCLKNLVLYEGFEVFIPSLMKMSGFRIKEIKIKINPRRFGSSKFNIRNRLWKELLALLVLKWMQMNKLNYKIKYIRNL